MRFEVERIDNTNATALLAQGRQALTAGDTVIDLSAVRRCDSSAVALMLALRREAQAQGRDLKVSGGPAELSNLAHLYGVDGLI